jgi:hypothetical protein
MIVRGGSILVALALAAAACGGEAFTTGGGPADGSAGSATAGAGGSGSQAGSGGATGGSGGTGIPDGGTAGTGGQAGHGGAGADAGACPAALPQASQACSTEGLSCAYGKCCPTHAICSGGSWQIAITDCAVPGCPPTVPAQGASCTCVSTPVACHYACTADMKTTDATCVNDVWSTVTTTCPAVPCGQSMCMPRQICVKRSAGAGILFQCSDNPCGDKMLSCSCAASVCPVGYTCGASATTVSCSCPTCV